MDIGWPGNISLKKIVLNPGNANPITRWYWGWWENLVPTGTFRCFIENNKIAWREGDIPLTEKEKTEKDKIATLMFTNSANK